MGLSTVVGAKKEISIPHCCIDYVVYRTAYDVYSCRLDLYLSSVICGLAPTKHYIYIFIHPEGCLLYTSDAADE